MTDVLWLNFLLITTRITSFFVTLPFMSYRGVPNLLKVFFAVVVAYLIFISKGIAYPGEPYTTHRILLYIGGEVLTGLAMGFVVLLLFVVYRMAGQFMDVKIGLAMASVFDPQFGSPVTLLSQFYYLLAIIIFFAVNGHHHLFLALSESFRLIPPGGAAFTDATAGIVLEAFYGLWALSFQIAAPVIATAIITDISLGLISKTVPQLHVFLVGLPLKVFLGFLVVYLTLPYMSLLMEDVLESLLTNLMNFLESIT